MHGSSTTGVDTEASSLNRGTLEITSEQLSQVSSNRSSSSNSRSSESNNGSLSSSMPHEQYNVPLLSVLLAQVRWIISPQTFKMRDLGGSSVKMGVSHSIHVP